MVRGNNEEPNHWMNHQAVLHSKECRSLEDSQSAGYGVFR